MLPIVLLGVGMGAFIDGIVLHQILQWHHMLSDVQRHPQNTIAGLEANTLADGLFHAGAWVIVLIAVLLIVRRRRTAVPSWRRLAGWLLIGWGAFNTVEAIVNHQLLSLHHVRDDVSQPLAWDVAFLVVSVALIAAGWLLAGRASSIPHVRAR
jgi:uncharacterized membrane protein